MSVLSETIKEERRYGDFLIRLQYINPEPDEPGSQHEPAMVIARPRRVQSRAAWVIMLSAAWKYVDPETDSQHSKYMVMATAKAAEMLGLRPKQAFQIAEAILDNIEDLINMPPVATTEEVVGEAVANIGGTKISAEIMN